METVSPAFEALKVSSLSGLDRSPKGSIDSPFLPILNLINESKFHVTTSCCSGRISVFDDSFGGSLQDQEDSGRSGKGFGHWLFVSHEEVDSDLWDEDDKLLRLLFSEGVDVQNGIGYRNQVEHCENLVYFKFEPLLLHLTSSSLAQATKFLQLVLNAGFRNSGIITSSSFMHGQTSSSNYQRINIAVRPSPRALSVPIATSISKDGRRTFQLLVSVDYLRMLLRLGNQRMRDNRSDLLKLERALKDQLTGQVKTHKDGWEDKDVRKERKRKEGLDIQKKVNSTEAKATPIIEDVFDGGELFDN